MEIDLEIFFLTTKLIKYNSKFNSIIRDNRLHLEQLSWVTAIRLRSRLWANASHRGMRHD